ncbi:MAG TPA: ATP-binding protein [Mycobacterium sp.]
MSSQGGRQRLHGRVTECETLRGLVSEVQSGSSRVLVLRGEAGVGKTALLEYVAELASGFRCVQVAGVERGVDRPRGPVFRCGD